MHKKKKLTLKKHTVATLSPSETAQLKGGNNAFIATLIRTCASRTVTCPTNIVICFETRDTAAC
jgi:hypothetical protein